MPTSVSMSGQVSLFGAEASDKPRYGLFVAIFPADPVRSALGALNLALKGRHGLAGTPVGDSRLHVTLADLGEHVEFEPGFVESVIEALSRVKAPAFEVGFDRAMSFQRKGSNAHPFVLCPSDGCELSQLLDLRSDIVQALGHARLSRAQRAELARPFNPHMTFRYDHNLVAVHEVDAPRWTATEFVLVKSLIGATVHVPLQIWPLSV